VFAILDALTRVADLPLHGAGGEPVDFARTIVSHGVAELPPNRVELAARTFETTLPMQRGARTVRITASGKMLHIEAVAGTVGAQARSTRTCRTSTPSSARTETFRGASQALDASCVPPTVFEDVVKTK